MGILRNIGKTLGGFLFTTFLVLSILMITIARFTDYSAIKPLISPFLEEMLKKEMSNAQIDQIYSFLLTTCQNKEKVELPLGKENLTLNCAEIKAINPENLTSLIVTETLNKIYFKQYKCEFIQCLREEKEEAMLIFLSSKANEFFKNLQNLFWLGTMVGAIILFISVETWQGRLKAFGISCLSIALPFFFLSYIKNLILSKFALPTEALTLSSQLIDKIIASLSSNFLFILIAGIALTFSGYFLEYFLKK